MRQILNFFCSSAFLKKGVSVAVLGISCSSVFALPSDRNQPISLVADRATYNEKTGVTTYTGNVMIEQGTMKLQADSIVGQLNSQRQLQTVNATGRPQNFNSRSVLKKELRAAKHKRLSIMLKPALLL